MTFTETLFGGMLVIVILYFILRFLRLSNHWSAILSGVITLGAFLAHGISHGLVGDVVAIHVAFYSATTAVVGIFGKISSSGIKVHWIPKIIILFFVTLVMLMALFLSISIYGLPGWASNFVPNGNKQHVHTNFSGTTNNSGYSD
jgi:hypothetical protein